MLPAGAGPLSNDAFTQNNYYNVSGMTAEQLDSRARRQGDAARNGGVR
jgi:predicted secreted Zn-dependent protease